MLDVKDWGTNYSTVASFPYREVCKSDRRDFTLGAGLLQSLRHDSDTLAFHCLH